MQESRLLGVLLPILTVVPVLGIMPAAADSITSFQTVRPGYSVIDFEDFDSGGNLVTTVGPTLTVDDVTFTSLTGTLSIFDISLAGWGAEGTEISSRTLFPGAEPDSAIRIDFSRPVAEFLLGWGDPNFSGNVLRAFDSDGNLLEDAYVELGPPGGTHAAWIGFRRLPGDIASILVQPDQSLPSGDDYVIDNIHYRYRVPEPSTLLLLCTGLIGVAATKRRFR